METSIDSVTRVNIDRIGESIARSCATGQFIESPPFFFPFERVRGKGYRSNARTGWQLALESHARSLVLAAKMSVYVMSAPLDNWHTRKSSQRARRSPGVRRG